MSYASWMAFSVPLMLVNTVIAWLMIIVIQRLTLGKEEQTEENQDRIKKVIAAKKRELGKMSQHEWQVVFLFITLIILWFFQSPKFMEGKSLESPNRSDNLHPPQVGPISRCLMASHREILLLK